MANGVVSNGHEKTMANGVVSNGHAHPPSPSPSSVHAMVFPYPLQGHIIPAAHLALRLASRGITVTFVNTEASHHQRRKATLNGSISDDGNDVDMFAAARQSGLDIRYELVSDGLPVTFDRSLHHDEFMESLLHNLPSLAKELIRKVASKERQPALTCLISDTFFVWPATVSRRLGLTHVSFWTEPALVFTLYYHLHLLRENRHFGCKDKRGDVIEYLPGVPSICPGDLMSYLQDDDINTVVHRIIYKAFEEAKDANFVLCNTVQELEPSTIAALNSEIPFYPIGPIFPQSPSTSSTTDAAVPTVSTSMWAESDCTQWLTSREPGSVLYVSFGSYAHVKKHVLHEIALGIMDSGVGFLWVLRPDIVSSDDPNPLPEGFLDGTRDRGLVVPWCRQREVLAHPSVGGFLTHCGWNSILESVWAGVPLMCFPLLTDQFTNRRLVVKDWKVGVDVAGEGGGVEREEVARKVRQVMEGEDGKSMKIKVGVVRKKIQDAVAPCGSSQQNYKVSTKHIVMIIPNNN